MIATRVRNPEGNRNGGEGGIAEEVGFELGDYLRGSSLSLGSGVDRAQYERMR